MSPFIYLRVLRHVDYSVFSVSDGQKEYYDPVTNRSVAFSSGQQVKRSIIQAVLDDLNEQIAPIIFNYELQDPKGKKATVKEKEALSIANPSFTDQLLGGWMSAAQKSIPVKRRSPLSISAMRPLHPYLASMHKENMTFDRSSHHGIHKVVVKDSKGNEISDEDLQEFLQSNQRTLPARKFLQDQKRTGGLFVFDVAIDLRTLFSVSINQTEPEVLPKVLEELKEAGWKVSQNAFGECLVCPEEKRKEVIPALAKGLLNWRIQTNQSRTFSLMETMAIAVSQNANSLASAIRAKLVDERNAKPIIHQEMEDVEVFVTLPAEGYILDIDGDVNALQKAQVHLEELLSSFNYEEQMATV